MRIIGKTNDGFILEAREDEVCRLIGYYGMVDMRQSAPTYGRMSALSVGDEIKVSEMYQQLYRLKDNEETLKNEAKTLEDIAELLRLKNPIIKTVTKPAKSESEGVK